MLYMCFSRRWQLINKQHVETHIHTFLHLAAFTEELRHRSLSLHRVEGVLFQGTGSYFERSAQVSNLYLNTNMTLPITLNFIAGFFTHKSLLLFQEACP